ncbi:MAG: recombination protein NinG [Roseobacter sp.]
MFDAVVPIVMPVADNSDCPACGTSFTRKRSNQTYCSKPCQRKSSKNSARGDRSAENKQRSSKHYERAARLTEMIYTTPPQERLEMMKHILSFIP